MHASLFPRLCAPTVLYPGGSTSSFQAVHGTALPTPGPPKPRRWGGKPQPPPCCRARAEWVALEEKQSGSGGKCQLSVTVVNWTFLRLLPSFRWQVQSSLGKAGGGWDWEIGGQWKVPHSTALSYQPLLQDRNMTGPAVGSLPVPRSCLHIPPLPACPCPPKTRVDPRCPCSPAL